MFGITVISQCILCCKQISYVLHVQFCKSHKKWTIDFCLKQEQKKLKKREMYCQFVQ